MGAKLLGLTLGLGLLGCGTARLDHRPRAPSGVDAPVLLVVIPGRGDDPDDLVRHGLLDAMGPHVHLHVIDAPRSLLRHRRLAHDLHDEIIAPAREAGYHRVYVAGFSQGGLGALQVARHYGEAVDGVIVVAPFLGPDYFVDDIVRQGGVSTWSRQQQRGWWTESYYWWPVADDIDAVWKWVRDGGAQDVDLHVAWGEQDGFAPAARLLAEHVPDDRRLAADGGHEWETWRRLWSQFAERDPYGLFETPRSSARRFSASAP